MALNRKIDIPKPAKYKIIKSFAKKIQQIKGDKANQREAAKTIFHFL